MLNIKIIIIKYRCNLINYSNIIYANYNFIENNMSNISRWLCGNRIMNCKVN